MSQQSSSDLVYKEFLDSGAILKGHFLLSSGLHSDSYVQCALALKDTKRAVKLCKILYDKLISVIGTDIDLVVSPAMGGMIVGYEIARNFAVDFVFFERVNNVFTLKRNFSIPSGSKVLIVEDVITTGASSMEVINLVQEAGAKVIAEASLVDRSNGMSCIKFPIISLIQLDFHAYEEENLPDSLRSIPVIRPGTKIVSTHTQ